ncbi:MAG: MaoC family dehydratase [Pseudomonadota bacterium]|nr:MaoC family dehydratase [Pseudomonadota bacterium]
MYSKNQVNQKDLLMTGLYYEQFEIGMEFNHSLTRTVTESDNLLFCALTHNPQPLHLDEEFSKGTEYGQRIVNSLFTLGLVIGVSVGDTTLGTTIGNLGMTDTRFANPVFHGDTIRSVTKVREKRISKSRPNAGLVIFEHYGFNQRDEEVAFCVRTAFMMRTPS